MQTDLWHCLNNTHFHVDRHFMTFLFRDLDDDLDTRHLFFKTIFEKMHLSLPNMKHETFPQAEKNLEILKALLEYEGAGEVFVNSSSFYNPTMNGATLQKHSYLGRYLSFTALTTETFTWKSELSAMYHRLRPEQQQKTMDTLSQKFFNICSNVSDVIKKLMKHNSCKERLLLWLRQAVNLNHEKQKFVTYNPIASTGFALNYITTILILCKPFTGNFQKYSTFLGKINCFYLANNSQIANTKDKYEKIEHGIEDQISAILQSNGDVSDQMSGVTLNPFTGGSSLMDDSAGMQISPPNFISDCFFLAHIMISYMTKSLEQFYKHNHEALNKAVHEKNYEQYDQIMAQKLSMDAHIFGKNIVGLYRSLFSFTNALLICQQERVSTNTDLFKDLFTFMDQAINPISENDSELPLDFRVLPQCILNNLNTMPKLMKDMSPECYFAQDVDLQLQMGGLVSIILNRRISNPHMRIEFIEFLMHLVPQKSVPSGHEKQNNMYKNEFFNNIALKKYLMHALIIVYIDSEKTDYYGKFQFRFASSSIMEFIWQDKDFRNAFMDLPKYYP